jgi:hypothetical protein
MTDPPTRRPLPALVFLLALTLLTGLVWWRVLHRGNSQPVAAKQTCTSQPTQNVLPRPASVTVAVLNSTQRAGIAAAAQKALAKDGFTTPDSPANDTGPLIPGVAEVRYGSGELLAATLVSYYFPGSKLVALNAAADTDVVVSLGSAYRAVATPAAVQAALVAAHASQAPATPTSAPSRTTSASPSASASC